MTLPCTSRSLLFQHCEKIPYSTHNSLWVKWQIIVIGFNLKHALTGKSTINLYLKATLSATKCYLSTPTNWSQTLKSYQNYWKKTYGQTVIILLQRPSVIEELGFFSNNTLLLISMSLKAEYTINIIVMLNSKGIPVIKFASI